MLGIASLMLGVAIAGNALVTWRVRRATRGMGTQSLAWMLDFYEGVLRAAREGLLLVDAEDGSSSSTRRPANCSACATSRPAPPIEDLHLPAALAELLSAGRTAYDELHLGANGVVVVNQQPARSGRIVTLRDHTQLQALLGELDAVRSLAESLQAQNHEASNRLHTVVSLIEIGRPERAREFAVSELQFAQAMTDRVVGTVGDPVLASLLLAKLAQAQERGVLLTLELGSEALNTRLPAQDVVTVVGNLLDNAIEAARGGPAPRRVELKAGTTPDAIDLAVTNTGAELGADRAGPDVRARLDDEGRAGTRARTGAGPQYGRALAGDVDGRPGLRAGRDPRADRAGPAAAGGERECLTYCASSWSRTTRSRPRPTAPTSTACRASRASASPVLRPARSSRSAGQVDLVLLDMNLPDGHGLDVVRRMRAAGQPNRRGGGDRGPRGRRRTGCCADRRRAVRAEAVCL